MKKDFLYVCNVIESIKLIERYTKNKKIIDLKKSLLLKDAVSKRLEEIGENMKYISPKTRKYFSGIDWKAFVEIRNFLTHVYQLVNVQRLWAIIKKDVPNLKKEMLKIKKSLEREDA